MRRLWIQSILLIAMSLAAPHAHAAVVDEIFELIRTVQPTPEGKDGVEFARYYVSQPVHGSRIYSRLVAQDYAFAVILGAAKAARGQKIPGTNTTFGYQQCRAPMTLFDAVFNNDEYIEKYGQDARVKAYLSEQNGEAKQAAFAKLSEYVPYLGDVEAICHFTFHTNFKTEEQIRAAANGKWQLIKGLYQDIGAGRVAGAVSKLIQLGVSSEAACAFADQALTGGLITKTPILGDIASTTCSGFVGKVLNAPGDAAEEVIDAFSNAGDWLSGQSGHMATDAYYDQHWRPRVKEGAAHARAGSFSPFLTSLWNPCKNYFDSHQMDEDNAQEVCDFHRDALFSPAVIAYVEAEDAAVRNRAEIAAQLPLWGKEFLSRWQPQCFDGESACRKKIAQLRDGGIAAGKNLDAEANGAKNWATIVGELHAYDDYAAEEVRASRQRFVDENARITAEASAAWAKVMIAVWTPRCWDEPCRKEILQIANMMAVNENLQQSIHPEESSLAIHKKVLSTTVPQFERTVKESNQRRILDDPHATAEEKLPLLGCKSFLGRKDDWLCTKKAAFDSCVKYVKKGGTVACRYGAGKAAFATPAFVTADLAREGCVRSGRRPLTFRCEDDKARAFCRMYSTGGMSTMCLEPEPAGGRPSPPRGGITLASGRSGGGRPAPIVTPPRQASNANAVPQAGIGGCTRSAKEPGAYSCSSKAGYDACQALRAKGKAERCVMLMRRQ